MISSLITKSSIKDEIMEITEEFKEFKFRQNLQIEFTKSGEVWFGSEKIEFNDINIDELLDIQPN